MQLAQLTDQDLLDSLASLVLQEKQCLAAVIDHLAEVDARAAYRPWASSLFVYATLHLHLSEASAYKRITAARLVRRFPCVLDALHRGDVHLSALSILSPHLTEANCAELLLAAKHKTTRAVELLVADRFPKADVPQFIRKLPNHSPQGESQSTTRLPLPSSPQTLALTMAPPASVDNPRATADAGSRQAPSQSPSRDSGVASVGPLAADRYKVQFTASKRLHDKLRVAQQLLSHRIPKGDVAAVLEAALDHLIDDVMHERFATPRRRARATQHIPEQTDAGVDKHDHLRANPARSASTPDAQSLTPTRDPPPAAARRRYIPAAIRRQVIERDGLRCTHVDPHGQRCTETHLLELHHLKPFGQGGGHDVANLTLRCKAHNLYAAERDYGTELIRQRISARQAPDPRVQPGV